MLGSRPGQGLRLVVFFVVIHAVTGQRAASGVSPGVFELDLPQLGVRSNDGCIEIDQMGVV